MALHGRRSLNEAALERGGNRSRLGFGEATAERWGLHVQQTQQADRFVASRFKVVQSLSKQPGVLNGPFRQRCIKPSDLRIGFFQLSA